MSGGSLLELERYPDQAPLKALTPTTKIRKPHTHTHTHTHLWMSTSILELKLNRLASLTPQLLETFFPAKEARRFVFTLARITHPHPRLGRML